MRTTVCIVLNGTSCSGKPSIAAALQEPWPRPLQVTGIETFLASQSKRFFAVGGRVAAGFSWFPLVIAEQRERERGDRIVGTARGQYARVHAFREYDVDVDTSVAAPGQCAEEILAERLVGSQRSARWDRSRIPGPD